MTDAERDAIVKIFRNIAIFMGIKWGVLIWMNRAFRKAAARAAAKS